ncbi:MAG: hypothetical protein NVSMB13_11030 [Mycobacteriales bacterium]
MRMPSPGRPAVVVELVLALAVLVAVGAALARSGPTPAPTPAARTVPSAGPPARPAAVPAPPLAPLGTGAQAPTGAGVAAALAPGLANRALGQHLAGSIVDVATATSLYDAGAAALVVPASTAKLVTAAAALSVLGPDARLSTRVVAGAGPGELVLVGGGDPTLAGPAARPSYPVPARMTDLATGVAGALAAGTAAPVTRVVVDFSLFAGPTVGPQWKPAYLLNGNVAPVGALEMDGGRVRPDRDPRVPDPALAAGRALLALLQQRGIGAGADVVAGAAPVRAQELARVESPPMSALVEAILRASDNDLAEALGRQVALRVGRPATFEGAVEATRAAWSGLGLDPAGLALLDSSGLSPADRLRPGSLTSLLVLVAGAKHPELRPLLTGLPVAGFAGTLADRYRGGPATPGAGDVRGKTGTLEGVSALAGLVVDGDGRLLAFDLTADALGTSGVAAAEGALDRLAATLAGCGCR